MADENAPPAAEPELDFSDLKKKKKKKVVAFDPLDIPPEAEDPPPARSEPAAPPSDAVDAVNPKEDSANLTLGENDDLDFSDLKRKKKKKAVALDLEDVDGSGAATPTTADDEFADLKKKKKKGGKKAFDLEAFERELAEEEGKGPGAGSDDEAVANEDAPEDGLFGGGVEDEVTHEKTKAQIAADKKAWLQDPDRDYTYDELLGRFYQALYVSHPTLSGGAGKKRYTLAPPSVHREGNKRSIWANVGEICKKLHRQPEHVIQFLFAELGTNGSVDGNQNLVIKGRYQQKQIENVLRRYIAEYVTCKTCKSPDTLLEKDQRLVFMTCESCGSKRSVSAIKTGYSAQIGKRKKVG